MNKRLLLLLGIFSLVWTGSAETTAPFSLPELHTPGPPYPAAALAANITGTGMCHVVFGSTGHVRQAAMTKGTGSTLLDNNTVSFALKHWTGHPNTAISVPINYVLKGNPGRKATTLCKVTFDASGHVKSAVVTQSTGSKTLDDATVSFALKNWTGDPNTTKLVPITYHLPPTKDTKSVGRLTTPRPPYPYEARAHHEQGDGVVEVTFDASGRAVRAVMTKSTGHDSLDQSTVKYVLENWKSSGGERTTLTIPVAYRVR